MFLLKKVPCLLDEDSVSTSWIKQQKCESETVMGGLNELEAIKISNKCIIDTKHFTFNVVWCIYCMWLNEINERDKLFPKQPKTVHNALHVIKFANRLYRVTIPYSLYYTKLKQIY